MRFPPGARVRVAARAHAGHCRTPVYLRGKTGTVECVHGTFTNPETRAYGADGLPGQPLYGIVVRTTRRLAGLRGTPCGTAVVDVYEHWLEEA